MATLANLISAHNVEVHEHLDREELVPVTAAPQRQGDVMVIPQAMHDLKRGATTPVPAQGVAVIRGEAGGNTHLLLAEPGTDVRFDFTEGESRHGLDIGVLTVAEGATAFLAHPEHGYVGIAPGSYVIGGQREQADEIRRVQD